MNRTLCNVLAAIGLASLAFASAAQTPLKLLIPAEPGSAWDQAGRTLGAAMVKAKAAASVQIDNAPGAGGTLGLAQFANASKGDTAALMIGGLGLVAAVELDRSAVPVQRVTPLARLATGYEVVVVAADSPLKSMSDLMKAFKAGPGAIAWGAGAVGSPEHLTVALLARAAGVDPARIRHVALNEGDASKALVGGRIAVAVVGFREAAEARRGGKVRALGVSGPRTMDGIPSLREQGINVVFGNWIGLFAAPGLRPSQRDNLLDAVRSGIEAPEWMAILSRMGWTPVFMHGSDYARFIDEESRSLGYLVEALGLRRK
ncbi:MAG: tripartite tricarboxylate transporter substrate binding protein [Betaproteobacteria bacterium]|nr:tripartite tricarboxylate transporter substrate binding protein [Betaproteobacteria bacterium]